jgi:hypothetical protein
MVGAGLSVTILPASVLPVSIAAILATRSIPKPRIDRKSRSHSVAGPLAFPIRRRIDGRDPQTSRKFILP